MNIVDVLPCGHGPLIPSSVALMRKGMGLGTVLALIIDGAEASIQDRRCNLSLWQKGRKIHGGG
jgi:uncharacterized membrane protein YraQ (UPF0718 family)